VTPAPEIIGVDLDGAPMRLSDFRGQVVAVSFWANWCVHCRDLFPHEKAMVETFKDQPFVLVGVNADEDSALARQVQEKHGLTWRSFFIGDPDGLVPHEWKVRGWPTIVLVDPAGNIRYRFEGKQPENVERAIRVLLRETAPK
jgi:thiol-disulfide isomerase/thioredoxin